MQLLFEPQAWLSFLTLTLLEIVLGIDNIILLSVLVARLPAPRRASRRSKVTSVNSRAWCARRCRNWATPPAR